MTVLISENSLGLTQSHIMQVWVLRTPWHRALRSVPSKDPWSVSHYCSDVLYHPHTFVANPAVPQYCCVPVHHTNHTGYMSQDLVVVVYSSTTHHFSHPFRFSSSLLFLTLPYFSLPYLGLCRLKNLVYLSLSTYIINCMITYLSNLFCLGLLCFSSMLVTTGL